MLELWFDFSCPYAYLATRRAKQLAVEIDWRPMLLGGVFRGIGAGDGPMATISPQKQAHNVHDMHRWADLFGEPFRLPPAHPMRTVLALRTLLALPRADWPAAIEAIYAAYWQRGEDVSKPEVIAGALAGAGIPAETIAGAAARTEDAAIKDELRRRTDEAISLGIFGAPAWIRRDLGEPLLIWGQDRMPWVEAMIAGWKLSGPPPGGARRLAPSQPAVAGKTLDVYFDVSSPFAYLGLTQLPALAGIGVRPRLVPILLGALFRDIQQANVPWFAMPPPKQRYFGLEMQRWASWWGEPFELPRKFPQRTIAAQRLCIIAASHGWELGLAMATALGRAMWGEQRDLEDTETLRSIVASVLERRGEGFPDGTPAQGAQAWLDRTQDAAIKAELAANTAAAREAGVFGVPTFVVDGKHLFWGQDRLELVARALAGWTPP
ncbi:MAG TPA: 2-hydroxychromene-2-carboxylate isomerase [Kofleriaceae bacterium]|nr:2-hydroxychromene-2-carboxylate isomerase [Kofleriaceae bacterium]